MKMLVIGATGGTGRCVVESALQADSVLRAMQAEQAVICALGPAAGAAAGTIISEGSRTIIHAMAQAGARWLVFESGIMVGEGRGLSAIKRILLAVFRTIIRALSESASARHRTLCRHGPSSCVGDEAGRALLVRPPLRGLPLAHAPCSTVSFGAARSGQGKSLQSRPQPIT